MPKLMINIQGFIYANFKSNTHQSKLLESPKLQHFTSTSQVFHTPSGFIKHGWLETFRNGDINGNITDK